MEYYAREVEKPSDLLLLLQYINRSSDIDDEYWEQMINRINNNSYEYIVIGIYRLVNCKTCITKFKPEMLGFLYIRMDEEFDVIALSLEAEYNENFEIGNIVGKYLKKRMDELQINRIKFHSMIRTKEWYETFFGIKMKQYNTMVWEG